MKSAQTMSRLLFLLRHHMVSCLDAMLGHFGMKTKSMRVIRMCFCFMLMKMRLRYVCKVEKMLLWSLIEILSLGLLMGLEFLIIGRVKIVWFASKTHFCGRKSLDIR